MDSGVLDCNPNTAGRTSVNWYTMGFFFPLSPDRSSTIILAKLRLALSGTHTHTHTPSLLSGSAKVCCYPACGVPLFCNLHRHASLHDKVLGIFCRYQGELDADGV